LKIFRYCILLSMTSGMLSATDSASAFLNQGFGARSAALGNAYGAMVADPSALYWNPAGLARVKGQQSKRQTICRDDEYRKPAHSGEDEEFSRLLGEHNPPQSGGTRSSCVDVISPSESQLHVSSGLLAEGNLVYLGSAATSIGNGAIAAGFGGSRQQRQVESGNVADSMDIGYLGYGWGKETFRWGISLFGLREQTLSGDLHGFGTNLGIQYSPIFLPGEMVVFSGEIRNLGALEARPRAGYRDLRKLDTLMSYSLKIDLGYLWGFSGFSLLIGVTANLDDPNGRGAKLNSGFIYSFNRWLSAMAGLNDSNPSVGLNLNAANVLRLAVAARRDAQRKDFEYFAELQFIF
jgi:hypothetical protein